MRVLKRVLGLTGLTGVLAAFAAAAPASAQQGAMSCAVSGKVSFSPAVQVLGGTGGYTFAAQSGVDPGLQLNCAIGTTGHGAGIATVNVNSSGTFQNTACGTDKLDSSINTLVGSTPIGPNTFTSDFNSWLTGEILNHFGYDIWLAGNAGALRFRGQATNDATGYGPIQVTDLTPQEINSNANVCTSDFQLTGSFAAVLP